jgi:hypothetical protein
LRASRYSRPSPLERQRPFAKRDADKRTWLALCNGWLLLGNLRRITEQKLAKSRPKLQRQLGRSIWSIRNLRASRYSRPSPLERRRPREPQLSRYHSRVSQLLAHLALSSQDRQGGRHRCAGDAARPRRRGDRVVQVPDIECCCNCSRRVMAQSGHPSVARQCPLSGGSRTSRKLLRMSAFDPKAGYLDLIAALSRIVDKTNVTLSL